MINVPSNLSGAVNRQTVMNINNKKIQEPLSSRNIDSINTKFVNAASPNSNSTHTGSINTQSVNAAYINTNSRSAGPVNTRSANTAPTNSGNHSFNSRPVPTIRIPAFKNPVRKDLQILLLQIQAIIVSIPDLFQLSEFLPLRTQSEKICKYCSYKFRQS